MILLALSCTMVSGVLFGFSRSLVWAFVARSMQGLCNGNVGIIRTAVAEIVPEKVLQPRAFSIMPLVWTVGSIFGPALGGALVHPVERFPAVFRNSKLFEEYPYAFPNVLCSFLFLIGITSGFLFLRESLEDRRHKRDYGLVLGQLLISPCRKRKQQHWRVDSAEATPFHHQSGSQMSTPTATPNEEEPANPIAPGVVVSLGSSLLQAVQHQSFGLHLPCNAFGCLRPTFANLHASSSSVHRGSRRTSTTQICRRISVSTQSALAFCS